jgi:uncharacterized caspase-like protein
VLVGVETCRAASLRGPACDVEAMRRVLVGPRFGFSVDVLLDRDATRVGILQALERMIAATCEGDVALFYFSGHGIRAAICPHDYDRGLHDLAITDVELASVFDRIVTRGARLTAILDCCFSGALHSPAFVLAGCSGDQIARNVKVGRARMGVFTHHLAAVMDGLAHGATNREVIASVQASIVASGEAQSPVAHPADPDAVFLG